MGSKYKSVQFYRFIPGIKLGIEGRRKRKKKEERKGKGKARAIFLGEKREKKEKDPLRVKSKE